MSKYRLSFAQFLHAFAIIAIAAFAVAVAFVWSGVYNISAARKHTDIVSWLLDIGRRQSVQTYSQTVSVPPLTQDMLPLGAAHYELGCAPCHGAPGRAPGILGESMLPLPPLLTGIAKAWSPAELFWIVRNGQKYTGMPSWIAPERHDEVWPIVAFLRRYSEIEASDYAVLAGIPPREERFAALDPKDRGGAMLEQCARCHGHPGEEPRSDLVPALSGQTHAYLLRSLREYKDGRRLSGYMQLAVDSLSDDDIVRLASHYASKPGVSLEDPPIEPARFARGSQIALRGLPAKQVPPCLACHGGEASADFPRLAGQSPRYMAQQLAVWRAGHRAGTPYGAIMARIAQRLDEADVGAVTLFLRSLPSGYPASLPEERS